MKYLVSIKKYLMLINGKLNFTSNFKNSLVYFFKGKPWPTPGYRATD